MGDHGGTSWPLVKFGDMAQNVTRRVDPAETDAEICIGLEHLDSECLRTRQWGSREERAWPWTG